MSGETESNVSAWTVDSLRDHVMAVVTEKDERITERDRRLEQRFEAQEKAIETAMTAYGAAIALAADRAASDALAIRDRFDTLLLEREKAVKAAFSAQEAAMQVALTSLRDLVDTILAERDERYDQRATALEKSHEVALGNVIKEFTDRIDQVRSETVLAMAAAEKAISKAEAATERRFESVNEFRAQQADIIQTFARKTEVDTRLIGLTEKVDSALAQAMQVGAVSLPRNEYDRAHTDLAERVVGTEKALNEKIEAQVKTMEARISLLQSQISSIEAVTR